MTRWVCGCRPRSLGLSHEEGRFTVPCVLGGHSGVRKDRAGAGEASGGAPPNAEGPLARCRRAGSLTSWLAACMLRGERHAVHDRLGVCIIFWYYCVANRMPGSTG